MDLTTNYLGFSLKNPLVAAASPMSREVDAVKAMEDAGIAAVVVYSLFEEQIAHERAVLDHFEELGTHSFAESLTYAPARQDPPRGPEEYVRHIGRLKHAVDIPVMGSLNGTTVGGWMDHAQRIQEAGADALELNIYYLPTDPRLAAADVEKRYLDVLAAVKERVSIPVAVKLGPYFSSLAHFARRLDEAGVDGLVLFNRFYQPDIDLDKLEVIPDVAFSARHELRLALRWVALLDPLVECSLAGSTAVYDHTDVLKLLMAGADVAMLCAALLTGGPGVITDILNNLKFWMEEHEYVSVHQMQGSLNYETSPDPSVFERANYMKALTAFA